MPALPSSSSRRFKILLLGGTADGRRLAEDLGRRDGFEVLLSLAGRTQNPAPQPVPVRVGGFGGVEGLARFLEEAGFDGVVDATHPYAARISRNAAEACARAKRPLLAFRRPPWQPQPGDLWRDVDDMAQAVTALGPAPRRVFLALGRNEVRAFEAAPQHHYLIRSVDPVVPRLSVPNATYLVARGPFDGDDERHLLAAHGIETIVAKNSGGPATYGKMAAARTLGIEVLLLRRPPVPDVAAVENIEAALAWLEARRHEAVRGE
ncbi:MAG: cobalt-precorrin-6A reductase [Pseudomonadota bacterium]